MFLPTSHFIPMKVPSRSRSSTGSWDSNSSGSFIEDSEQVPAWGSRWAETRLSGGKPLQRPSYNEKIEGKNLDEIQFNGVNLSTGLGADQPDLLDRLIMEDQEEKLIKFKAMSQPRSFGLQLPSLENLLKLLEIQQMSSNLPEGRPITGGQASHLPSTYLGMTKMQQTQANYVFPNMLPPVHYKVPPPHHPPAVPSSFHLPTSTQLNPARAPFSTPSYIFSAPSFPTPGSAPTLTIPGSAPTLTIPGSAPTLTITGSAPTLPIPGSAVAVQLRVDEAKWQYQAMEKERKKAEAALAQLYPGKKISSSNSVQIPRLPLGPTKLDKLVVDCLREQARVITLLDRVEKSKGFSPSSLYNSLSLWKESVLVVMAIRRRERMEHNARDIGKDLDEALSRMSLATRKARTVLWVMMVGGTRNA